MVSDLLVSVGGGVYEMRCVCCGETFMMAVGDQMTCLVRNNGTETAPIHETCKGSDAADHWLKTGKAMWE